MGCVIPEAVEFVKTNNGKQAKEEEEEKEENKHEWQNRTNRLCDIYSFQFREHIQLAVSFFFSFFSSFLSSPFFAGWSQVYILLAFPE